MRDSVKNESDRKVWVSPEMVVLSAGSAEAGNGNIPDGGGPGNSRS